MWEHYYAKAEGLLQGNAQDTIWVSPLTEQNCQECACRVASHADVLLDRHGGTRDGPLRTAASRLLVGIFRCSRDARGHKKGKNDERASFLIQPCRPMCLCVLEAFPWSFLLHVKNFRDPLGCDYRRKSQEAYWFEASWCVCSQFVEFFCLPKFFRSNHLPLAASKRGHETKETCSYRVPDMTCFAPKHLKFASR